MAHSRTAEMHIAEGVFAALALTAAILMLFALFGPVDNTFAIIVFGLIITVSLAALIRLLMDPDRVRARQSNAVLTLASRMLATMGTGLNQESAQKICEMLLPATNAIAVAITDKVDILGYAGSGQEYNELGSPIRTVATHETIADGRMRVLYSSEEIGFPVDHHNINAAILVPLNVGGKTEGTLKFYFPGAQKINETQQSIARGFGEEEQRKLATSMELKALQAQINPHFLFNTLNTIASFTRTDPERARLLLREFSKFYRGTLENASDLIPLAREVDQTQRYLQFEIARFGEERLGMDSDVPDELASALVPAFMVQPLVENSVRHAMPATGKLTITVKAEAQDDDLLLMISDDGKGMSEDRRGAIMKRSSSSGLGIAVRNIRDRVQGYYGSESYMQVDSAEGEGTTVTLFLKNARTKTVSIGDDEADKEA